MLYRPLWEKYIRTSYVYFINFHNFLKVHFFKSPLKKFDFVLLFSGSEKGDKPKQKQK